LGPIGAGGALGAEEGSRWECMVVTAGAQVKAVSSKGRHTLGPWSPLGVSVKALGRALGAQEGEP
jgi:hypothetical protein